MNRTNTYRLPLMLAVLLLTTGCASVFKQESADKTAPAPLAVTIMAFNVENLFDNDDDAFKDDKAYLPIEAKQNAAHVAACNEIEVASWRDECLDLDWNDAAIEHKLSVLADTIRQVSGGLGADIIALQEVENLEILERLRTGYLADIAYEPAILVEGADLRGIDVAFLSKLPLAHPPILHPLTLSQYAEREGDTRGVLQADFQMADGSILTGFSVHFPAPYHPTGMRIAAYRQLTELLKSLPDERPAFAAGDFNTTSAEDRAQKMLDTYARPDWTLAHDIGCGGCKGSHYYARDDSWSFLDMILFAPPRGGNTTAQIRADSVQIANRNTAQVSSKGTPERYNSARRTGVSDHWPMIATIEVTQKQ
ncbi:MAG: endonuclease/exonuclease/phosphatase family protein [Gammaproteobacteria bacterium]|nr:endonuclease/exonuclease/phosphatase family protein [Gammaproteobacteria bacterium]MBT8111730.1 endonuclease/exonuclease/phosphatase family protein [Gammaproteobacteria bacterium]NNL46429.1 hypothetical protein [Woeseiaceae bacterium]